MNRLLISLALAAAATVLIFAQQPGRNLVPITAKMLENPSPNDWLMYNRTYDSQRYSPLKQIDKANVGKLKLAWSKAQGKGSQYTIPLVHDGVMYLQAPGSMVQALDATNGNVIWEYQRPIPDKQKGQAKAKTIAISEDMVYWTAPDNSVVALDARTGELRWEAKTDTRGSTQGAVIAGDKVISGGTCPNNDSCYISAHDAKSGKLLWKFYTGARTGEPGGDTWGDTPDAKRTASTWGLPGTYDPLTKSIIWSVANPTPNSRAERQGGEYKPHPGKAPMDLYSNSTISINPETGKLNWYYQHLPGDDWDEDWTNDRTLVTTALNPTAATAKWFNKKLKAGERRDIVLATGEPGGVFALDRRTGEFLWANPWPYDVPNFFIKDIDEKGLVQMNTDLLFTGPNQDRVVCFFNTRSYWSQGYSPVTNSLYVPFVDTCNSAHTKGVGERSTHDGVVRDETKLNEFSGISKINASTGKIDHIFKGPNPINGAMLLTAGDLLFFGDLGMKFRALDANDGKVLWEETLPGPIANSTITYAVNGRQYVAVLTGDGGLTAGVIRWAKGMTTTVPRGANGLYVFALPETPAKGKGK
jgi:alcohol dehydrogenase (cytochrome c)